MKTTPRISIVIPSYNSKATLPVCLRSILSQSTAAAEVLVADSSEDGTRDLLESEFPQVRWLSLPAHTPPGAARNAGAASAVGEYVAFVDSDVVLPPNWLEEVLRSMEDDLAGVCSAIQPYPEENYLGFCLFLIQFGRYLPGGRRRRLSIIPSFAFLTRRASVLEAGGFPEDIPVLEDFLFSAKLARREGRPFLFCPSAPVCHINKRGWDSFRRHLRRHGYWSAVARSQAELPGSFLTRMPAAALLLVPYRLLLISAWSLRWGYIDFLRALAGWPLIAAGLLIWANSFRRAARGQNAHMS